MTLDEILSNVNYNIEKIVEELRKRIMNLSDVVEIVDKRQIIYQCLGRDFCVVKIKNDHLEIDFKTGKSLEDPINFSWKIRRAKKEKFDRRMHIKNMFDIETVFVLISQSYNHIHNSNSHL